MKSLLFARKIWIPEREGDPLLGGKKVDKSDLRPFEAPSHHDDAAMQRIQRSTRIHIEMRAFTWQWLEKLYLHDND